MSAEGRRPAPRDGLPEVTIHPHGFTLRTAQGNLIQVPSGRKSLDRFLTLWWDLHNPANGYFSRYDVPFHSAETFIVEAPDYGHLTTSETVSFWVWLEVAYARFTGDFSLLHYAMDITEEFAIPKYQPTVGSYNSSNPALYAPEEAYPALYPVPFDQGARPGKDPLSEEFRKEYGDSIYGMHWLIDTTNWYGFGSDDKPNFINTFQRGVQESVWETIPHPSVEDFRFGSLTSGYLDLFARDSGGYKRQWRYTTAPDADARIVQAIYDAWLIASAKGDQIALGNLTEKAAKMGDFLRYSMFDKYFKPMGCESPDCPPGNGQDNVHYLLSWYYSWGGSSPIDSGAWSWRIGSSHAHFGYQNPVVAYALSKMPEFKPKTASGALMWAKSLDRQLEFYQWLQSSEGAIAGGATNSYRGQYGRHPDGLPKFYGMVYEENPVYQDPGSNSWFGWQAWSMQRVAQYYRETGDPRAANLLDRWVDWISREVKLTSDGAYEIPATLGWSGAPVGDNSHADSTDKDLNVKVLDRTRDVGVMGSLAKTLLQYAQAVQKHRGKNRNDVSNLASDMLDRMWTAARDTKGLSVSEQRSDYRRLTDPVYVPPDYRGMTADGATIDQNATFSSLRPKYKDDPEFNRTQDAISRGETPVFNYHRFWAQVEAALAYAELEAGSLTIH